MNTSYTAYEEGFTGIQVLARATELLQDRTTCLFTLGGFGGNITVGDSTIPSLTSPVNMTSRYTATPTMICMVLCWINPEETPNRESCLYPKTRMATDCQMMSGTNWQEANITRLPPSRNYEITYYRPTPADGDVKWKDNQGKEGYIYRNTYHTQGSYYPAWMPAEITFRGKRLADNSINEVRVRACPSIG